LRILFLHEVNYLTKPIFEMHEFPEHLARLGHEVGFVQFPEGLSQSQIKELGRYKRVSGRVIKDAEIELITPWTLNGSLVGRLFTAIFSYWQVKKILREFQPDVVVSFSVPTSGWQALIASRQVKAPYVFRALDVSHKIRQGVFSGLVKRAERFIYGNSSWVSANNPAMRDYCIDLGAVSNLSSVELPPLDLTHFGLSSSNTNDIRGQLGLKATDRVFLYMGSFFYFSGLPEVIASMTTAPADVKLVLVGGGEQDSELREQVKKLGLDESILFAGFVSFDALPSYLKLADVAINAMQRSLVSNTAFPNKVIQYLASGVPVVSTRLKGLETTFEDSPALVFVDSPEEVMSAAVRVIESDNPSRLEAEALTLVQTKFDLEHNVRAFESRLREVVEGGK
jgi:glycosyltransferase involved in cell wall biosynthesis